MSQLEFKNILDVDFVLQRRVRNWRNQEHVRRHMISQNLISEEQHQRWLAGLKQKKDKYWVVYSGNNPVGMVYLTDVDEEKRTSFWGFYIADEGLRGQGLGKAILQKLLTIFFDEMNFRVLKTQVLSNNETAFKLYEKFLFRKINTEDKKEIFEYEFDQDDWKRLKQKSSLKKVVLLLDFIDLNQVAPSILEKSEFIAVTPGAMLALEEKNLSYKTFDDYFAIDEFRAGLINLFKESENLFTGLDQMFEDQLQFPWGFTGNMYWFWVVFGDAYYLSKICVGIKMNYGQIYLIGLNRGEENFQYDIDFSPEGLAFIKYISGIKPKIKLLKEMLEPTCIWLLEKDKPSWNLKKLKQSCRHFFKRAGNRIALHLKQYFDSKNQQTKENILVIQGGYELKPLRRYLQEYNFIAPLKDVLAQEMNLTKLHFDKQSFDRKVSGFIGKWFTGCETHVSRLFDQYRDKILPRLTSFSKNIHGFMMKYDPKALLFAGGSNMVYEQYCVFLANQRGIPVISFQHGLTAVFFDHPYRKYSEQNCLGEHLKVLNSKIEEEYYSRNNIMDSTTMGSLILYEKHQRLQSKKIHRSLREKTILYCPIYFHYDCYKGLMFGCAEKDLFNVNKEIIQTVKRFNLRMDIKLHVVAESDHHRYFKNLLKKYSAKEINLLSGFPVEQIMDDYDLIVLDYNGTILTPMTIIRKVPVILYLKDVYSLREEYFPEMQRIFYIARNREDLERYLGDFKKGNLPAKYDLEFVDKYCYPVNEGNVGVNIAQLVVQRIKKARNAETPVLIN